jgi:hypothetical protein
MRSALLLGLILGAAQAAELSRKVAEIGPIEIADDGQVLKTVIKVKAKATFIAVGGYSIDKDAKFQFYRGGKSVIEVAFKVRTPPPVVKAKARVLLYAKESDVPYSD